MELKLTAGWGRLGGIVGVVRCAGNFFRAPLTYCDLTLRVLRQEVHTSHFILALQVLSIGPCIL